MKKINIKAISLFIGIGCLSALLLNGCSAMDDPYKDFVKDGPIIYMGKINSDSIIVSPGRNRVQFSWPAHYDPRVKYAKIWWANNTKSVTVDIVPNQRTTFTINDLSENTYIFNLYFLDSEGHSSVGTLVQGTVYGDVYEDILQSCSVKSTTVGSDLSLIFSEVKDESAIGTKVFWTEGAVNNTKMLYYPHDTIAFTNYSGFPVNYCAVYKPELGAIDEFYSDTLTYTVVAP